MTGRTHDLAAFTALNLVMVTSTIPEISLATALCAFSANMIGGLTPDIDQPTADLWRRLPAGTLVGKVLSPLLGGHRYISHSIAGIILFAGLSRFLADKASTVVLVNMDVVWYSFMIGYISHLIMDTFTKEGVPWLFPIPIRFGIPPLKFTRIKTGGLVEKSFIFPMLLMANAYIFYKNYSFFLNFLKHFF
jgi:inner membrane protein